MKGMFTDRSTTLGPSVSDTINTVNKSSSDLTPLEHLFVAKFSRLTIDDEYKYNLSYLVSPKTTVVNGNNFNPNKCSTVPNGSGSNQLHNSPMEYKPWSSFSDPKYPGRLISDDRNNENFKNITRGGLRLSSPKRSASPISCIVSDSPDDMKELPPRKSLNKLKSSKVMKIERLPSSQLGIVSPRDRPGSPYSGLHIYVTKSPMTYLDVVPSYDSHNVQKANRLNAVTTSSSENLSKEFHSLNYSGTTRSKLSHLSSKSLSFPHGNSKMATHTSTMQVLVKAPKVSAQNRKADAHLNSAETNVNHPFDLCYECGKRIYAVDRMSTGDRVYHKSCFRCATCHRTLLPGNFASLDGVILCRPHYIEQFRLSGACLSRPNHTVQSPIFEGSASSASSSLFA